MSKFSLILKSVFVAMIVLGSQKAAATVLARGNDVGHGGNSVICGSNAPVVLDYYNATLGTLGGAVPDLLDLQGLSADQTIELIRKQLAYRFSFLDALDQALANIGPMANWISTDLIQVDDSDEPYYLPTGCVRKTAAIRQDPFQMYGDPSVINAMVPAQQGLLMLHEAFYLIAASNGATTSTSVRNLMRALLVKNPVSSALESAINDLKEFGGSYEGAVHPQSGTYSMTYIAQTGVPASTVTYEVAVDSTNSRVHVKSDFTPGIDVDADCSHYTLQSESDNEMNHLGAGLNCKISPLADGTQFTFFISYNGNSIAVDEYAPGVVINPSMGGSGPTKSFVMNR